MTDSFGERFLSNSIGSPLSEGVGPLAAGAFAFGFFKYFLKVTEVRSALIRLCEHQNSITLGLELFLVEFILFGRYFMIDFCTGS